MIGKKRHLMAIVRRKSSKEMLLPRIPVWYSLESSLRLPDFQAKQVSAADLLWVTYLMGIY